MKTKIVGIGVALVVCSIIGYVITPDLISKGMNMFTAGSSTPNSPMATSILSQLGIPSIDTMTTILEYSYVGIAMVGLGMISIGLVSRKIPNQFAASELELEDDDDSPEVIQGKRKAFHILQERLAKGEITSKEFLNLKKLLEEEKH